MVFFSSESYPVWQVEFKMWRQIKVKMNRLSKSIPKGVKSLLLEITLGLCLLVSNMLIIAVCRREGWHKG